jgi:cation diffusion facilitator CzcD-associated flavoprotein CzcO
MEHVRVAVIGTGFAGIGASIVLQRDGVDHVVLERAAEVGGTWRDNTYPGCRCDVPSHLYSFSFAPNPEWSETYSPQPEIQAYLRTIAVDHGVVARTRFGSEVLDASWNVEEQRWYLTTASGPLTADVVLLGNGPLAEPAIPDIHGLESFEGDTFHSARWRHDVDLNGKRIAVIGTGASAIQFVPEIQPAAGRLTVFQRTPAWVMPHRNRPISSWERAIYRRIPLAQRLVRGAVYWSRELFVTAMLKNGKALERMEELATKHLRSQVRDPELLAKLTPGFRPGCKRLLLSNDWYPALQQDNVELVTEKIIEIRPRSIVTADGVEHDTDVIIFGTGFRVTDNPVADRIHGADGRALSSHWAETGAQAYLGTTVPDFPNLFLLAGPNTGIGHTSLVVMIEAQLGYIADALRTMETKQAASVNLRRPVHRAWTAQIQKKAAKTVWNAGGCASWYLDAEGRNTTIWPDHTFTFRARTRTFDAASYELTARIPTTTTATAGASR